MRRLVIGFFALALGSSCAGFKLLDRADWVLVWSDEVVQQQMVNGTAVDVVKPAPGAKQEVIPLERYESERTEGKRRTASAAVTSTPKLVTEITSPMELMIGEVREVRVEEPTEDVQVFVSGSAVRSYWTKVHEVSGWKGDQPKDTKESSVFLLADDAGGAKLKVQYPGKEPIIVDISVHEK
jgi:hypothetical protein